MRIDEETSSTVLYIGGLLVSVCCSVFAMSAIGIYKSKFLNEREAGKKKDLIIKDYEKRVMVKIDKLKNDGKATRLV